MKRLVLAGLGALAVVTAMGTANAADIARRQAMPAKAPPYVAPYSWTGFYIGINGGGGFGNSSWSNAFGSNGFNTSGGLVGGTLGYNYQMGAAVFGLEGDVDWSNIRGSTNAVGACPAGGCETRNDWLGTARGRIGYAFDRFMPFVTGGAAFGDIKASAPGLAGQNTTRAGWTLGGGGEFAVAGPWSAKVEYLYVDLGKANCPAGNCAAAAAGSTDVNFHSNVVRGGINYRF
jgi:outer membrane immunogenic protein